LVRKNIYNCL